MDLSFQRNPYRAAVRKFLQKSFLKFYLFIPLFKAHKVLLMVFILVSMFNYFFSSNKLFCFVSG